MFLTKVLWEGDSEFNKNIKVIKSFGLGTYIQVNGLTQSGGIVESIWRQTLKKLNSKNINAKSILILGLGGGSVVKVIRKYWPEAKITGIEIDPVMIELGKKYLDLDKYNVDIKIQDARKFLSQISNSNLKSYNLVIVDTYLGNDYVEITGINPVMSRITVFNRLYFGNKKAGAEKFGKKLERLFPRVEKFYPPANLMYICYNN